MADRTHKEQIAELRAMLRGYPDVVRDCIANRTHLTDCDDDGYCNFCGHQENPNFDDLALKDV